MVYLYSAIKMMHGPINIRFTYELVAMAYPLLPTRYVYNTLSYSSKVDQYWPLSTGD